MKKLNVSRGAATDNSRGQARSAPPPDRILQCDEPRQGRQKSLPGQDFCRLQGSILSSPANRGLRAARLPPATVFGPFGAAVVAIHGDSEMPTVLRVSHSQRKTGQAGDSIGIGIGIGVAIAIGFVLIQCEIHTAISNPDCDCDSDTDPEPSRRNGKPRRATRTKAVA